MVHLLAHAGNRTAVHLHEAYATNYKTVSKQSVYRVLGRLVDRGMVVKSGRQYQLNVSWILGFIDLALKAQNAYFGSQFLQSIFDNDEKREYTWRFDSIEELCQRHAQLMILMTKMSKEKRLYQYHPHAWFFYLCNNAWLQPENRYKNMIEENTIVIGCDSFLLNHLQRRSEDEKTRVLLSGLDRSISGSNRRYVHTIDDFVLTMTLDQDTADAAARICPTISRLSDVERLDALFRKKGRIRLTITKDRDRAATLQRRFVRRFG